MALLAIREWWMWALFGAPSHGQSAAPKPVSRPPDPATHQAYKAALRNRGATEDALSFWLEG